MIAKVCTRDGTITGRTGFGDLAAYIGHEAKAIAITQSETIGTLDTAAAEMEMVASGSRSRVRNPAYHFVLSWPGSDRVSNDAMFDAVQGALNAIGFQPDHMWVAAIHGDSDFQHVHVVVNRIHPRTREAFFPFYDHLRLSQFCRELELARGWTQGGGLYTVDGDGAIKLDAKQRFERTPAVDQRAVDSEAWTGVMSFQRWVGTTPAEALRDALETMPKTWSTVHAVLGEFDLSYEPYRRGATIVDRENRRYRAKASHLGVDLSLPRLEQILGPYQAPRRRYARNPEWTYTASRDAGSLKLSLGADSRLAPLYAQYSALVEDWQKNGKQRRAAAVMAARGAAMERLRHHRAQVNEFREGLAQVEILESESGLPIAESALQRAVKRALDERLTDIRRINKEARAAVVSEHRAPPALFRSWLKQQAAAGDADAARALQILRSGERDRVVEAQIQPIGHQPSDFVLEAALFDGESLMPDLEEEIRQFESAELEMGGSIRPDASFDRQERVEAMTRDMDEFAGSIRGAQSVEDERVENEHDGADPHGLYSQKYLAYIGTQKIPRILWEDQLASERARETEIRSNMRDTFRSIKEDEQLDREDKQARRSIAQMEAAIAINNLNRTIQSERQMLHNLQIRHRIPSFAEYLRYLAVRDPQAQTVLEAIQRKGDENDRGYNADAQSLTHVESFSPELAGVKSRAGEEGSVIYTLPKGQEIYDTGKQIDIPKNNAEAIRAALLLGREKWVDGITVSGGKLFQAAVVREAAELGIAITNPELQKMYEKFVERADQRREAIAQTNAQLFARAEATKLVHYDSAEKHHQSFKQAAEQAAIATARDLGYPVTAVALRPDGLEGTVRAAWPVNDTVGYVVVETRAAGPRLIQVDAGEAYSAQSNYDKLVKVVVRDGAPKMDFDVQRTQERTR